MRRPFHVNRCWLIVLMVLTLLMSLPAMVPTPATADATIAVGVGGCALVDAITAANTDTASGNCPAGNGADTIVLETGATYQLTAVADSNSFFGETGLPVVASDITVEGNGATITRDPSAPAFRLLRQQGGTLTLQNLTLSNGHVNLVPGNLAGWGGCLLSQGGTLTIASSTLTGCQNTGTDIDGVALYASGSTTTITGSTFHGNIANDGAGAVIRFEQSTPSVTITNTTVTDNDVHVGLTTGSMLTTLTNVTMVADEGWSSVYVIHGSVLDGQGSILLPAPVVYDGSTFNDLGDNLTSGDPLLGPLQDNGGTTLTRVPLPGSPAFDAFTSANCPLIDQLGIVRPQGRGCEIGAVEVLPTPPVLTVPGNQTLEATGPAGATATFTATAVDYTGKPAGVVCTPTSGTTFAISTTTVNCMATDALNQTASGSAIVTVQDTTGPVFTSVPGTMTVEATGSGGAVATYSLAASDLVDGLVGVSCTPSSGSTFVIGSTTVNCSASDSRLNSSTTSFIVTVQDTSSPVFTSVPGPLTLEATSPAGAVATYSMTASDLVDGPVNVSCILPTGSTFAVATTTVNCSANDTRANQATTSFTVTVQDTTGPVFTSVPDLIAVPATSPAGAIVTYSVTASDLVDGSVSVTCLSPSGSTFSIGTTTVMCSATDSRANLSTTSFEVRVGTPVIASLSPNRVALNARSQAIVIRGAGFQDGATVRVGTTEYVATYISSTELRITIIPRQAFALGGWLLLPMTPVQVVNPGGVLSNGTYLFLRS